MYLQQDQRSNSSQAAVNNNDNVTQPTSAKITDCITNKEVDMKKLVLITLLGLCSLTFAQNLIGQEDVPEQITIPAIPEKQIECLARNMYFEAKSEPEEGIRAIGFVTLNRVNDKAFPKTICDVVHQRVGSTCQFSWVCIYGKNARITNRTMYERIKDIAREVAYSAEYAIDPTRGSLFFHASYISPQWKLQRTVKIGQHIFYSRKRQNDRVTKLHKHH